MTCTAGTGPTLEGFTDYIRNVVGVPESALPVDSPWIEVAYCAAIEVVNTLLAAAGPNVYTQAVYALGADQLIMWTPDTPPSTYFRDLRAAFNIDKPLALGVVQSAYDETTGNTLAVIEAAKNFTIADLMYLRTPYGQQYMAIAMRFGPIWGLS